MLKTEKSSIKFIMIIRRFIFFSAMLIAGPAFPQTPYDDIKESDKRVLELKQMLLDNTALPESFRMRYSGTRDNYLSFYDRENNEMYFRYREDRFDRDAEKKIGNLIQGEAYSVRGKFQGVLLSGRFYPLSHPEYQKQLADKNSILIFEYSGASPLKPEQILFGSGEKFYDPRFFFHSLFPKNL